MAISQYHNEWNRLHSYVTWPASAQTYPSSLSAAGFYYTGESDTVCCFCCSVKIGQWTRTDLPLQEHIAYSPHCKFILGEETGNIPIPGSLSVTKIHQRENDLVKDHCKHQQELTQATGQLSLADRSDKLPVSPVRTAGDGVCLPSIVTNSWQQMPESSHDGDVECIKQELQNRPPPTGVTLYVTVADILLIIGAAFKPEYADINTRLQTFTDWEYGHIQNPTGLAEAGFYYTKRDDRVRCFYCNGGLCNWDREDVPIYEHHRHFTRCDFIQKCRKHPEARAIIESATANGANTKELDTTDSDDDDESNQMTRTDSVKMEPESNFPADVSSLAEENTDLKSRKVCKICRDRTVDIVFLPCSHLVCCMECSMQVTECPLCKGAIKGTVKVYI